MTTTEVPRRASRPWPTIAVELFASASAVYGVLLAVRTTRHRPLVPSPAPQPTAQEVRRDLVAHAG